MSKKEIKRKEPTLKDLYVFSNKLYAWGVALIVVGVISIVVCLGLTIYFGIMQTIGLRHHNVLPFLMMLLGIACFGCVLSAGVYMVKNSKLIKTRLNEKLRNEMVNNENK